LDGDFDIVRGELPEGDEERSAGEEEGVLVEGEGGVEWEGEGRRETYPMLAQASLGRYLATVGEMRSFKARW
jgi:hypothetical protein